MPFDCEPFEATVVLDEFEEMEDDELVRGRVLRGINMPRASSAFIGLFPLIVPHADREICGKVGGLATAVMRKVQRRSKSMGGSALDALSIRGQVVTADARVVGPDHSTANQPRAKSGERRAARQSKELEMRVYPLALGRGWDGPFAVMMEKLSARGHDQVGRRLAGSQLGAARRVRPGLGPSSPGDELKAMAGERTWREVQYRGQRGRRVVVVGSFGVQSKLTERLGLESVPQSR